MISDTLTYDEIVGLQENLNAKKKLLQKKCNLSDETAVYAEEWLSLAGEYALIGSKANAAYCMKRYRDTSTNVPQDILQAVPLKYEEPAIPEPESPTYDWQERADMGD